MRFSFGTDPEFMLAKNGKIYSAIGIVKGTKERRKKIGKHEFYYDNVLAETAVAPGDTKAEAVSNIKDCLKTYAELTAPYKLEARASHVFTPDQLKHKDAFKIGCDPEACAYSSSWVEVDEETFQKTALRSAGGHIHLGNPILLDHPILKEYSGNVAVRLLDLFLGIPSIFLDHDPTTKARKQLYGQAGRWRMPKYGIEYRSVGNFWLSSPQLVELTYDICDFVLECLADDRWKNFWDVDVDQLEDREAWSKADYHPSKCYTSTYNCSKLRKAVDTVDVKGAKEFLPLIQKHWPAELYAEFTKLAGAKQFDLYKEWGLT
jgi:hypothetical protein